jgi:hypothetical protein
MLFFKKIKFEKIICFCFFDSMSKTSKEIPWKDIQALDGILVDLVYHHKARIFLSMERLTVHGYW